MSQNPIEILSNVDIILGDLIKARTQNNTVLYDIRYSVNQAIRLLAEENLEKDKSYTVHAKERGVRPGPVETDLIAKVDELTELYLRPYCKSLDDLIGTRFGYYLGLKESLEDLNRLKQVEDAAQMMVELLFCCKNIDEEWQRQFKDHIERVPAVQELIKKHRQLRFS